MCNLFSYIADVLRKLVLETIDMFGAHRCMLGTNYHLNNAVSDNDNIIDSGPSTLYTLQTILSWISHLSANEKQYILSKTAKQFYRL